MWEWIGRHGRQLNVPLGPLVLLDGAAGVTKVKRFVTIVSFIVTGKDP